MIFYPLPLVPDTDLLSACSIMQPELLSNEPECRLLSSNFDGKQTCATRMKWAMTSALCGAVGLLSTMSWIHWETLLKSVMKRSKMGLSTVQPCITKLW